MISLLTVLAASQNPGRAVQVDDAQIVKDFEARVSHYLEERRKEAGTSPKATESPEKLDKEHHALAERSKLSRAGAQRGDIFSPEIAAYLHRQIATALAGPQGARVRASLRHAEPVHGPALQVNQVYPRSLPLQSTPPSLLLSLPPLPEELQYRIVGHSLVLLDVAPKVVVDFLPAAIPSDKD